VQNIALWQRKWNENGGEKIMRMRAEMNDANGEMAMKISESKKNREASSARIEKLARIWRAGSEAQYGCGAGWKYKMRKETHSENGAKIWSRQWKYNIWKWKPMRIYAINKAWQRKQSRGAEIIIVIMAIRNQQQKRRKMESWQWRKKWMKNGRVSNEIKHQ